MATFTFLLSLLLGLLTIVGLLAPKKILRFTQNPSRKKALMYLGMPSVLFFLLFGQFYESSLEKALKNPDLTESLVLKSGRLKTIPIEVVQLRNLKSLDASKNKMVSVPSLITQLEKLTILNLSENPIDSLPDWIVNHKSLSEIDLSNTNLQYLPNDLNKIKVKYEGTPLWDSQHPEQSAQSEPASNPVEQKEIPIDEDHSESLGEFALRSLIGKDYGQLRKFGKNEVYYEDPVTKEQADQVGLIMQTLGLFNDENEVSVLLDEYDTNVYRLKMVVDEDKNLDTDTINAFKTIKELVNSTVFPEETLQLHLTNGTFETIKII